MRHTVLLLIAATCLLARPSLHAMPAAAREALNRAADAENKGDLDAERGYLLEALTAYRGTDDVKGRRDVLRYLGFLEQRTGHPAEAQTWYRRELVVSRLILPRNKGEAEHEAETLKLLGDASRAMKQEKEALSYYRDAVHVLRRLAGELILDSEQAEVWIKVGTLQHEYLFDPDAALAANEQALHLAPDALDARANRLEALFALGRYAALHQQLDNAIAGQAANVQSALRALSWAAGLLLQQREQEAQRVTLLRAAYRAQKDGTEPSWVFHGTRRALQRASAPPALRQRIVPVLDLLERPVSPETKETLDRLLGLR